MAAIDPVVLFRRSGVVAVSKPAGLATQAPAGIESVESWARRHVVDGPGAYLGVPHRLDRSVSGVLLLAETPRAARQLSRQFERRQVTKRYVALVARDAGTALPVAGDAWTDVVAKVADEPRVRVACAGEPGGREALSIVRAVEACAADRALLVLEPVTGRMHQLRIQSAVRGLPVIGDRLYGGLPLADDAGAADDERARPILLHALGIAWRDPDDGAVLNASAPLPPHWPGDGCAAVARLDGTVTARGASPRG